MPAENSWFNVSQLLYDYRVLNLEIEDALQEIEEMQREPESNELLFKIVRISEEIEMLERERDLVRQTFIDMAKELNKGQFGDFRNV